MEDGTLDGLSGKEAPESHHQRLPPPLPTSIPAQSPCEAHQVLRLARYQVFSVAVLKQLPTLPATLPTLCLLRSLPSSRDPFKPHLL